MVVAALTSCGVVSLVTDQECMFVKVVTCIVGQVRSGIDKYLIDGIYHDVLRGNVFQIDAINLSRHLFIICHPGWRNEVREFE